MNIIMSRAAHHHHPHHYSARGLLPIQQQHQPQQQQHQHHQAQAAPRMDSPSNSSSPTSPLDFTDRIPFSELRLSTETLGSGSFGTVFKGRWRGRHVAVKQFKTREEIDSFLVEVKQLSCVKHHNIVTLYGASTLSDTAYLIMEYAEGGSLNHLLHECKQQDYDLRHACSWAMQTARGVAYLHSIRPKPIMHRDLKPANLLLFSRGKILKICDFGTACIVKTKMTNQTGSALYMAPEVFTTENYLESADVFSWGIIFWEILVRCQPYNPQQMTNAYQIMWRVNQGTRPDEIEGCPQPIWYLITRAWDKDPTKRPSMHQVAKEIEFLFTLTEKRIPGDSVSLASIKPSSTTSASATSKTPCISRSRELIDKLFHPAAAPAGGGRAASPQIRTPPSNVPIRYTKPLLPSADSAFEKLSNANMTTSEQHFYELRHTQQSISAASTSSSASSKQYQHHYQNDPFSEQQLQQYRRQLSRQQEHSIQSQAPRVNRLRALQRHVEQLQLRSKQLEFDLQCDKKNSSSVSLDEFEELKKRIKTMRQLMRESGPSTPASSAPGLTPTCPPRPSSPPEEAKDALLQLPRDANRIDA